MLRRAADALRSMEERPWSELVEELKTVAYKGVPTEFTFNHLRIKYMVLIDGRYKPTWVVANPISGRTTRFLTVDYMGNQGGIYWNRLASAIRKS